MSLMPQRAAGIDFACEMQTLTYGTASNEAFAQGSFHHQDRTRGEFDEAVDGLAENPVIQCRMAFESDDKQIEPAP